MTFVLLLALSAAAQSTTTTTPAEQQPGAAAQPAQQGTQEEMPSAGTIRVNVVERTTRSVNYRHRAGATKIDFEGTQLQPQANGEAKVESKKGYMEIEVEFDDMKPAHTYGPEYLTYVLWAITPEGRAQSLGEILLDGNRGKLNVTSELQAFGMIVTAEPHFAVSSPSDVVVLENIIRADTRGAPEPIVAKYYAFERGVYKPPVHITAQPINFNDRRTPLQVHEARNAVRIAEWAQAPQYASDVYNRAKQLLARADDYLERKQDRSAIMMAREAAQTAESARQIAVQRREEERVARERREAQQREDRARLEAETEGRRRAEAELQAQRAAELQQQAQTQSQLAQQQAQQAQQQAAQAQLEAERAARERAEAEAARLAALQQQDVARAEAEQARLAAQQAEQERMRAVEEQRQLRERLRQQLNAVLQTRESARGLIVNMSDVLFETGKATLRPGAQVKLARMAGILQAHPGLQLQIEGHTDSVGEEAYNQKLSERRAASVRAFLNTQGVAPDSIQITGMGETAPVATNRTAAGRQQNRRVEIVVSGEAIGGEQAAAPPAAPQ